MSNDDWLKDPNYLRLYGFPVKIDASVPEGMVYVKQQSSYTVSIADLSNIPPPDPAMQDAINTALLKTIRRQEAQLLGLFMGETFPPDTEAEHLTVNESIEKAWKSVRALMPKRITKVREAYLGRKTFAVVFWLDGSINHVTATADELLYQLAHVDHVLADTLRDEWGEYQMGLSRKVQEMQTEKGQEDERDTSD